MREHSRIVVDQEHLLPRLKKPGIVVMDNASFHPKGKIKTLLEQHGHKLFCLPKYSPDLNPIEQTSSAMKTNWMSLKDYGPLDTLFVSKSYL